MDLYTKSSLDNKIFVHTCACSWVYTWAWAASAVIPRTSPNKPCHSGSLDQANWDIHWYLYPLRVIPLSWVMVFINRRMWADNTHPSDYRCHTTHSLRHLSAWLFGNENTLLLPVYFITVTEKQPRHQLFKSRILKIKLLTHDCRTSILLSALFPALLTANFSTAENFSAICGCVSNQNLSRINICWMSESS